MSDDGIELASSIIRIFTLRSSTSTVHRGKAAMKKRATATTPMTRLYEMTYPPNMGENPEDEAEWDNRRQKRGDRDFQIRGPLTRFTLSISTMESGPLG